MNPKRGEIWRVDLNPVRGSEQGKERPVVVLSEPPTGRSTMRLCAMIVHRKREHNAFFWCVELLPTSTNGLTKDSSADAAQTRALDIVRFEQKLGEIAPDELELIAQALCRCVSK
jgi:mRNA interferase MazF